VAVEERMVRRRTINSDENYSEQVMLSHQRFHSGTMAQFFFPPHYVSCVLHASDGNVFILDSGDSVRHRHYTDRDTYGLHRLQPQFNLSKSQFTILRKSNMLLQCTQLVLKVKDGN
jgi:hypothetical protein